jgi:hypothetical protein
MVERRGGGPNPAHLLLDPFVPFVPLLDDPIDRSEELLFI